MPQGSEHQAVVIPLGVHPAEEQIENPQDAAAAEGYEFDNPDAVLPHQKPIDSQGTQHRRHRHHHPRVAQPQRLYVLKKDIIGLLAQQAAKLHLLLPVEVPPSPLQVAL